VEKIVSNWLAAEPEVAAILFMAISPETPEHLRSSMV